MTQATEARRRINSQGDLDGACFLYSIVNAYVALTGGEAGFGAVCRAFGQVDHPGDFLTGDVGTTGKYAGNHELLQDNLRRILSALGGDRFEVARIEGRVTLPDLAAHVSAESVVVIRYMGESTFAQGMDHWVCVVGCGADGQAHIACSIRLNTACTAQSCRYAERRDPVTGRCSNDVLSAEHPHTFVEGEAFRITLRR